MATGTRLMQEISDQFLHCKICFESFREPKTLACLHTFCLACLQQQYEQDVSSRSSRFTLYTARTITCPLCRKKTELPAGGVRRLPDNFLVCNLNRVLAKRSVARVPPCDICASVRGRSVDACSKCLDCTKLLCKACVDLHLGTKVTQHHSLIDLEGEKDIACKVHTEEIVKFYCEPCGACICVVCAFQEHKDHDVLSFSDGYAKYRGDLESLLEKCKTRAVEVSSRLSAIDKYETVVKDVRDRIRDLAINCIAKVRAKEKELMKRIDDVYGGEVQAFVDSRPGLQENLDDLESTVQLTDIMLRDKGVEVLLIKRDIEVKVAQLLEPPLEKVPSDPALYAIRFVPGDVALGKLSFGGDAVEDDQEEDEITTLKKKEQGQMKNKEQILDNGDQISPYNSSTKATSPQNDPDVITNCTQTEKCRTKETSTSMQSSAQPSSLDSSFHIEETSNSAVENGFSSHKERSQGRHAESRSGRYGSVKTNDSVSNQDSRTGTVRTRGNGHSDCASTSAFSTQTDPLRLDSAEVIRARRRAEREARKEAASGVRSDRAPAPDLVPIGSTSGAAGSSTVRISSGAYSYTPGRMIRSRKIQTEISALDVEAGASNTDREFVQTMLQAELVAEKLRQEKEMASLSPRLRDRPRRVRTAEMGVMTAHQVRVVPEMIDKETISETVQHRDASMQALSDSSTNYTQTPVVRLENSGMCTDREGQAEKGTGTLSIDLEDKETCTAVVLSETKGTWTEGVATSDRATATMAIKLQHRAIGTSPPSTGTRGCQANPSMSAMFTNTPVITCADLECQATPNTCHTATMPDLDIEAKYADSAVHLNVSEHASDFLTPPQSPARLSPAVTCDRASDAYPVPSCNKSTEMLQVKTISSSTETPTVKVVDRDMATEETKTLDQWTETYTPTLINTGVTPPRPDTLEVGVATNVVLTDEQATCTDIKSFRDTHTETALVVCDGETLTDPVGHSDAQTSVETYTESRLCETDSVEVADETSMTDYYNPWEAVDTATQASQCDTVILKTKETNTALLKRKTKEAQTTSDPSVCPECGNVERKNSVCSDREIPGASPDQFASKAFRDNSTMPLPQVTQDVGTMAISCNACSHQYQETAIQTFQPQLYDKSSATSFDLHEHFLARALSREYHDVATSTDSLPIIGLLSEIDVDELIVVPDFAPELGSASGDSAHFVERVIMVDDETSMDSPLSVETSTQTLEALASLTDGRPDGDSGTPETLPLHSAVKYASTLADKAPATESFGIGKNVGEVIQSLVQSEPNETTLCGSVDLSSLTTESVVMKKTICSNVNCPSRQDKDLVSIGVNTAPKMTFEKETSTPGDHTLSANQMTIYVSKMDKGTSTLNRVRIVQGRAPGMGRKTKSVDKITMTCQVEQREIGVETEAQQVDGRITECISKLRSVSERLNSPTATLPSVKEAPNGSAANGAFFGKAFGTGKSDCETSGEQSTSTVSSTVGEGPERERQNHVKDLLEQTNAILNRRDLSPIRKPQPITTLKGRKPANPGKVSSEDGKVSVAPSSQTTSHDVAIDVDGKNMLKPEGADTSYASKSLPRGFTSERRSNTVKMGSQPLSPTRLPLHRYNSAPGRIATVPAHTLLIKSGGAAAKLGPGSSLRLSPNKLPLTKNDSPPDGSNNSPNAKALESKAGHLHAAAADGTPTKPQKRPPLPSITETRTPSSCSDNSTTSFHSSGSGASKRQSTDSAGTARNSSPSVQKKLTNVAQRVSPTTVPKSPRVPPKRLANISLGAPTLTEASRKEKPQSVKDAPRSPSARRKCQAAESGTPISQKPKSPTPKRVTSKDQPSVSPVHRSSGHGHESATFDPNRLSVQSATSSAHSRSSSTSTCLSVSMSESTSDTGTSSSKKSKDRMKSSPSKEKIKSSASTETIQSNTSNETLDGTKTKKSGGISFMQRFLSKKKKSSDSKKEPVSVKLCPPTADAVAVLSTLPAPVPAGPKESYAHVPLQHPPHHYIPQPEVKPQTPVHKPSSFVYVNQRLISIQQDNVEEKRAGRDSKKKSESILVAHKQAMFADRGGAKAADPAKETEKDEPKGAKKDSGKDKDSRSKGQACAGSEKPQPKKQDKDKTQAAKAQAQGETVREKETAPTESGDRESSKPKDGKSKSKKSEVKSASSWIRGRGDKSGKK